VDVATEIRRQRVHLWRIPEVELDRAATDDQVAEAFDRRPRQLEPEPPVERERLLEVATRQDWYGALVHRCRTLAAQCACDVKLRLNSRKGRVRGFRAL